MSANTSDILVNVLIGIAFIVLSVYLLNQEITLITPI
jgi:hypothetical protein